MSAWQVSSRPVVATPDVVAATTGMLFSSAGVLAVVATLMGQAHLPHAGALRGLGLLGVVIGATTWLCRRRLPAGAAHGLVASGTGLVTLAVSLAGDSAVAVALAGFYILIAVDSAFFFTWRGALVHLTLAVAACTQVLSRSGPWGAGASVLVGGTALLVAGVVAWLVRAAAAAETDPLTGLPNRRGLDRLLAEAVTTAERTGTALSLALIDLDHFKSVNDRDGHVAGDQLLACTAAAWQALLAPGQVLARQGGDEFTVVLPGASVAEGVELVDRLRAHVAEGRTCSAGVAEWDPAESLSLLFASADAALYQAKRAGRDCTRHHTHAASATADLRSALAQGHLTVHYQPIVDLRTGEVQAAEALLRWQHPERGLVLPGEFLPLVEGSDVMTELGLFVLQRACAQGSRWRSTGGPGTVTVNVAGRELTTPGYLESLRRVLRETGLPAHALLLEVTETSLDADADVALRVLEAARLLGVRVAIDDFGTGWSSLSRLDRLPADVLKIDRSFVQGLRPGVHQAPVIQVVLALAEALGLQVVAEGVEHPHQEHLLRSLGCTRVQGYLYGRPVPADQVWAPPPTVAPQLPQQGRAATAPTAARVPAT